MCQVTAINQLQLEEEKTIVNQFTEEKHCTKNVAYRKLTTSQNTIVLQWWEKKGKKAKKLLLTELTDGGDKELKSGGDGILARCILIGWDLGTVLWKKKNNHDNRINAFYINLSLN